MADNGFKPEDHLTNIKGKEYLEVKWRLVWFRQDYPLDSGWGIRTIGEIVTEEQAVYRAQIVSPEGAVIAEGTKSETPGGFADYIEKAETGAIGRALAICGYGTQFCGGELEEGKRIVDSPVATPTEPQERDVETLGESGREKFDKWLEGKPQVVQQAIRKELPGFLRERFKVDTVDQVPKSSGQTLLGWAYQRSQEVPEESEEQQAAEFFKLQEQAEQMGIPTEGLGTASELREQIEKVESAKGTSEDA